MSCAACSASVERATRRLDGCIESNVNLIAEKLTITYDEEKLTTQAIIDQVEMIGFGIEKLEEGESAFKDAVPKTKASEGQGRGSASQSPEAPERRSIIAALVLSFVLLYISMGTMLIEGLPVPAIIDMDLHPQNYALTQMLLALSVMFIGKRYFVSGLKSLMHRAPNMDTLVAVSCTCSFVFSLTGPAEMPVPFA